MFQNIKVDIIYYKTVTDFEMEFNLSGCCRMRLLTDKAPDRKILVNQLVRAVSRSRIIMIAGALFGEEGIIETCAKAIGRQLAKIDNRQFGIKDDDDIEIIEDAIPLVSSDGIFGGCIIEQGPQTLILLSENKNIRKNIMNTLIHSYVKEVCAGELIEKETVPMENVVEESLLNSEETIDEIVNTVENDDVNVEELVVDEIENETDALESISEEIPVNELIEDDEDELPQVVEPIQEEHQVSEDLVLDIDSINRFKLKKNMKNEYKDFGNEAEAYITEDDFEKKTKIFSGINLPILILTILLIIVAAVLCYSIFVVPSFQGIATGQYLKETFSVLFE